MSRVVVVGGGVNGLVAAARAAAAGSSVRILEAREHPGGLAAGIDVAPGYRAPGILHDASGFRPSVARALRLEECGLGWREGAAPGGLRELLANDDAEGLRRFVDRVAPALRRLLNRPPPSLEPSGPRELWDLATQGLGLRRLGARDLRELIRVLAMPAGDWLRDLGVGEATAERLAGAALLGSFHGPRSPGSAALVLLRAAVEGRAPEGGGPALVAALVERCSRLGVEVTTGCRVESIATERGRVAGVIAGDGERIAADRVIATCDPRSALLSLLPVGSLGLRTTRRLEAWRCRGTAAKVNLALGRPLSGPDGAVSSIRLGGGSLDALERAFDAVKYGELSDEPFLEVVQPSVAESGWAPEGRHVVSVLVGYAPYDLRGGWDAAARDRLLGRVLDRLGRFDPQAPGAVEAADVWTPLDLEGRLGLSGGHLRHGEEGLDQLLFMRPAPELSRYATPVEGCFLGGSGSHPGGGLTGVPGWLAAGEVLRRS